jgi:hypothetical protein
MKVEPLYAAKVPGNYFARPFSQSANRVKAIKNRLYLRIKLTHKAIKWKLMMPNQQRIVSENKRTKIVESIINFIINTIYPLPRR